MSNLKRSILIVTIVVIVAITFETLQQLYYINRFGLAEGVTFFELLKNQAYRWGIWMVIGLLIMMYVKRKSDHQEFNYKTFIEYSVVALFLVFINILIISILQLLYNQGTIELQSLIFEYIPFYIYQKALIYLIGYGSIAVIFHFYFINEQLQLRVQTLSDLKDINKKLYQDLKSSIDDKTTILNIKVGNIRKIIAINEIIWIEADDYCAKVHLVSGNAYTMRSSLKELAEKLPEPFLRVHRKAIVNMSMAKEFISPILTLSNGQKVRVSKTYLATLKKFIKLT